jgi:hypothetical protein
MNKWLDTPRRLKWPEALTTLFEFIAPASWLP